jgi:hypothetical protein
MSPHSPNCFFIILSSALSLPSSILQQIVPTFIFIYLIFSTFSLSLQKNLHPPKYFLFLCPFKFYLPGKGSRGSWVYLTKFSLPSRDSPFDDFDQKIQNSFKILAPEERAQPHPTALIRFISHIFFFFFFFPINS